MRPGRISGDASSPPSGPGNDSPGAQSHGEALRVESAALLALLAGSVEAYGFITYGTYVSLARLLFGVWAAFISGALLAGMATARVGVWTLLPPLAVLSALAVGRPSGA